MQMMIPPPAGIEMADLVEGRTNRPELSNRGAQKRLER